MKTLNLDHAYTPPELKKINQDLSELTIEDDPEQSQFLQLVTKRDEFIQSYIQTLHNQPQTNFVTAELKVNGALVAYAEESFKASLKQLTELVRGRKMIKKYR